MSNSNINININTDTNTDTGCDSNCDPSLFLQVIRQLVVECNPDYKIVTDYPIRLSSKTCPAVFIPVNESAIRFISDLSLRALTLDMFEWGVQGNKQQYMSFVRDLLDYSIDFTNNCHSDLDDDSDSDDSNEDDNEVKVIYWPLLGKS